MKEKRLEVSGRKEVSTKRKERGEHLEEEKR
jgi:hypothetical protein